MSRPARRKAQLCRRRAGRRRRRATPGPCCRPCPSRRPLQCGPFARSSGIGCAGNHAPCGLPPGTCSMSRPCAGRPFSPALHPPRLPSFFVPAISSWQFQTISVHVPKRQCALEGGAGRDVDPSQVGRWHAVCGSVVEWCAARYGAVRPVGFVTVPVDPRWRGHGKAAAVRRGQGEAQSRVTGLSAWSRHCCCVVAVCVCSLPRTARPAGR